MSSIFDLSGKIAIVTGASSGLGYQFAKALSAAGATVAIAARREDKLESLKNEIESSGGKCLVLKCDVANEDDIKNAVEKTINEFGKIDILINNAGTASQGNAEDMDLAEWNRVLSIDLTGIFLFAKYVGKHMIENKYGKIVNTASIAGLVAFDTFATSAYSTAKGGVVNLTRALAAEWGKHNITVNAIAPGFFPSEMTQAFTEDPNMLAYVKSMTALNRWGKDGELNGAMIYLSSDTSSYTTGQIIAVDGGWTAV